jgi:hypothetical protein
MMCDQADSLDWLPGDTIVPLLDNDTVQSAELVAINLNSVSFSDNESWSKMTNTAYVHQVLCHTK